MLKDRSLYTGTVEAVDIRKTLDIALKLHPKTKHFVVYGDNSPTYLANKEILERIIPDYESSVDFIFKDNFNIREIREHIRKLPSNSLILLISTIRDEQGQLISFERSAEMMAAVSSVPIYGCWDFFLGHGIVGGKLISGFAQGETAAKIALCILNGEKVENIPVVKESPNRYMFDYKQMQRFDVKLSQLPAGSIIINKPYSFYSEHKVLIWSVVVSMACLTVIILSLATNIITRKRAEEALRQSEEKYRTFVDNIQDGAFIIQGGKMEFVNEAFARMAGYTVEEVIGMDFRQLAAPEDSELVADRYRRRQAGADVPPEYEFRMLHKDGKTRCFVNMNVGLVTYRGRIASMGTGKDITERKKAEEALKKADARYRSLFESVPVGLYRTNPKGEIIDVNQTAVHMLGYPDRQALTTINASDLYVNAEDRQRWQAMMERDKVVLGFEVQFHQHDDTIIWVRESSRIVRDAKSQVLYYDGSFEDITEMKRLEGQLQQSQKIEAIGTLAGGVAHDFNNILQAIQGYTDIALLSVKEDNPLYRNLIEIRKASIRAASLTRQLLIFSRRQPMEFTPINLNTTVENLLKMLHRLIGEDIAINTELDPELWAVQADGGNIEQAIMNLTVNARDAMPEGGEITIKTENVHVDKKYCKTYTYARPGKFVCLTVEDTGVGMDKETIQRIFDPFFSTKKSGTGLGLSVIYGILKQHDGWVNVYSEPGQGSTLKIYLPASSLKLEEESEEMVSLKGLQGSGERILLVEDEKEVREFATRALGENGYVVFEAASAEEALDIFEREKGTFHLIFSDVVLTGKTGLELVDQLLSRKPELRVLLSSGYTNQKSQWTVIKERGFQFLQKPYGLTDLLRAIREAIG